MSLSFTATDCHVCGKPVLYKEGRRRCKDCYRWFHAECGMDSNYKNMAYEALCMPCLRQNPRKPIRALAKAINRSRESVPSLEVIIWSTVFDQDEAEISAKLKIPLEDVYAMSKRLRDQGVWKDGKVCIDCDVDAPEDEVMVCLLLASLCASGEVVRARCGDRDGHRVRDEGDTK